MTTLTFFNTDASIGGAGRAAYSLMDAVRDTEFRARFYTKHSGVVDDDVRLVRTGPLRTRCQELVDRWCARTGYPDRFRFTTLELANDPWIKKTEIFHLYNLHGGYFSVPYLPFIVGQRPVVWLLADMWPITGGCTQACDCRRWLDSCGECPSLDEYPRLHRDTTRQWHAIKEKTYGKCRITVVTPSNWLRGLVKRSPLLGHCDTVWIPTGIDMRVFRKLDKRVSRAALGVRQDSTVVLVSANSFTSPLKGSRVFGDILDEIAARGPENLVFLFAGKGTPAVGDAILGKSVVLGKVNRPAEMAKVYSAADLFVFPTRADNLPKSVIESLACGTPCVASDVGGVPEIIEDGGNGCLVDPREDGAFSHTVLRLLYDDDLLKNLSSGCRSTVIGKFDIEDEADAYRQLYRSILRPAAPVEIPRVVSAPGIFSSRNYAAHSVI